MQGLLAAQRLALLSGHRLRGATTSLVRATNGRTKRLFGSQGPITVATAATQPMSGKESAPKGRGRGRNRGPKKPPVQPRQISSIRELLPDWDPENYDALLQAKASRVAEKFAAFKPPDLELHRSETEHYRMRAEFAVWHDGPDCYYVMFSKANPDATAPERVRVDEFPVATKLVNELMVGLMDEVKKSDILKERLFQANFHTTLSGQACMTLIYHKTLDAEWEGAAKKLKAKLAETSPSCKSLTVIGRSRKQKVMLDEDFVVEQLTVSGKQYEYKQIEGGFTQPNAGICKQMLEWALNVTQGSAGDMLELYCGNGNFTIPLAQNFANVVATEVSKTSVKAAHDNLTANGCDNIFIARMSSEEFTEAWTTGAKKRRLEGIELDEMKLDTLLVDPPRAGLDGDTCELMRRFKNVVYISCNPDTLHDNLAAVQDTFKIKRFAMFDQFPYTDHIECGVYLENTTLTE